MSGLRGRPRSVVWRLFAAPTADLSSIEPSNPIRSFTVLHTTTRYMRERAANVLERSRALDGSILELGCGQGTFLHMLGITVPERTFIGFDPSSRRASTQRIRIERCYFDRGTARRANGAIAAVASRHVIEHLPSPVDFLMTIRATLPDLWPGRVFTETPTVEWILDNRATYDFFYEHCNYFTKQTLEFALSLAGLACSSVDLVFGDQYLWAESSVGSNPAPMRDQAIVGKAEAAASEFSSMEAKQRQLIDDLSATGLAVWGAGAKGVTFASLLDPDASRIQCLIDVNPQKQGRYIAGSGHPILDAQEAWKLGVRSVLVMNSNYLNEIRRYTETLKLPFHLSPVDGP